jgi:hypothetical protein
VALTPLAPVQHVHETEEHGLRELLVHSHSSAHHGPTQPVKHEGIRLEDQDTVVLTLDPVFALPDPTAVVAPPVVAVTDRAIEPPAVARLALAPVVERLTHSPPRAPAVLRGPPSLSRL